MLFSQIVAFILVMAVFESYSPPQPELTAGQSLMAVAVMGLWLAVGGRLAANLFLRRLHGPRPPRDPARSARTLVLACQVAAVACLLAALTSLELKAHLLAWRPLAASETLAGLAAAGLFLGALGLAWWAAHPVEVQVLGQSLSTAAYVRGQARFVAPVIFPWLAISLLRDLIAGLWPRLSAALDSSLGDLFFLAVFLVLMALFFPPLVRWWWGCRPLAPGPRRELIQAVLDRAGVAVAEILVWPVLGGRLLTAGILGLARPWRYLLITPALLDALTPEELMGVAAHEAGHVRHHHLAAYLLLFVGFFILAYALAEPLNLLINLALYGLAGSDWGLRLLEGSSGQGWISLFMALPLVLLLLGYLRLVMGFFMRHFERQADFFALDLLGEPGPVVGALERIGILTGDSRRVPSWHHFSIAQRSQALHAAAGRPGAARRQGRVIRRGLVVYLTVLALLAGLGGGMMALDLGASLRQGLALRVLEDRLTRAPHDPRGLLQYGVLQYERGRHLEAKAALEAALSQEPDDPEVQNALAWLLATTKDPGLRDPARALALAHRAVTGNPAAHIWDTLAEALFANHQPLQAAAAARAALAAGPPVRPEYYRQQLERFERAARQAPKGD
ncbi:MAG: M48 family metallopeptidase [Desulfarculus sp.]|nr:M48 family metallopeptidase [Desulfarculus sp.]